MNEVTLSDMGLDSNPFDLTIAGRESSARYHLYGRDIQLEKINDFVTRALTEKMQQRIMIRGEYGTGKTHHLLRLQEEIQSGKYGSQVLAVYMGNLGVSLRRFYEVFLEQLEKTSPELSEFIRSLPPVEPEESADTAYKKMRLRDNILSNISNLIAKLQYDNYEGVFLLVDEAEDIVQSKDNDEIQYFIQSLVHLVNTLQAYPLHMMMGFSREALSKISTQSTNEPAERRLGDAFFQRFQGKEDIVLGYLTEPDARAMVLDRLNSARPVPSDSLYPIHEGVISVVNTITGGHPREILAIMNKGIENALKRGVNEVDGECILQVLATHVQYFNKEIVLDWGSLEAISAKLGEEDIQLKSDFDRLRGKLIGENGAVSSSDFSKKEFAELLTHPFQGIRILERETDDVGKTYYIIHDNMKAEIFKGKRYTSKVGQLLDIEIIKLIQSPERYQRQLVSGFWRLLQEEWKAEFKKIMEVGNNQVIVGKVRMPGSSSGVSVAFTVFKGHEFPLDLFNACITLMEQKIAHFGCVLYDGPRIGADPHYNRFKNELREQNKKSYCDNIVLIKVTEVTSDVNQLMGTIMLLGNREAKIDEKLDTHGLFEQFEIAEKIETMVNKKAISYPEDDLIRRIINYLAVNPLDLFSITDLKKNLNSQYITKNYLETLESQRFILKEGKGWRIASLNDDPPWKALYTLISEQPGVIIDQIKEYLNDKFVLQCPPGDEGNMVNWYLGILMSQNMVVVSSEGEKNHYSLMDYSGQLEGFLSRCNERINLLREFIIEAEKLRIEAGDFKTKLKGFETRLETLEQKVDIGSKEVTECQVLLNEIDPLSETLTKRISGKKGEYSSLVTKMNEFRDIFIHDTKDALSDGFISEIEHEEWNNAISNQCEQLGTHLENQNYTALEISAQTLEEQINQYRTQIGERQKSKDPCVEFAIKYTRLASDCSKKLEELTTLGYEGKTLDGKAFRESLASLDEHFHKDYTELFNSGKFDAAKTCISKIHSKAQAILNLLNQAHNTYQGYSHRVESLEPYVQHEEDLKAILNEAREALKTWNFAILENKIKEFEDVKNTKTLQPKTPEDIFIETFKKQDTVTLPEVLKKYSVDDAFKLLKNLYLTGKIQNINVKLK